MNDARIGNDRATRSNDRVASRRTENEVDDERFARLKDLAQTHGCALVNAQASTRGPDGDLLPAFELWSGNDLLVTTADLDEVERRLEP